MPDLKPEVLAYSMIWSNCQEHKCKYVPSAPRDTRGNIAQAGVPKIKVKGMKMEGTVNSVAWLR